MVSARGKFWLFTDDDVLVRDGWADALVNGFSNRAVGVIGGRVLPLWPFPPPPWLRDGPHSVVVTLPDLGPAPRELSSDEPPVGANMAVRAESVSNPHSAFDRSLGPRGALKFDYDEVNFVERIRSTSMVVYEPGALVFHRILAERMDRSWLRRTYLHHGIGAERHERMMRKARHPIVYRLAHFALTALRAWRWKLRNDHSLQPDAESVAQELATFAWVGRTAERIVGRFPPVSDWLAGHLA
jgi:hypothetical protein